MGHMFSSARLSITRGFAILTVLLVSRSSFAQRPYLYLHESDVGSPDSYFTILDESAQRIGRRVLPLRPVGVGIANRGSELLIPWYDLPNSGATRLRTFDPTGLPLGDYFPNGGPSLDGISWFDVDSEGNFYWSGSEGIQKISSDGMISWNRTMESSKGFAAWGSDAVFVSANGNITRFDAEGGSRTTYPNAYHFGGAMDIDEAAGILYLGHQPGEIIAFDIAHGGLTPLRSFSSGMEGIFDLTVDHFSGNVIACGHGWLAEFSPQGQVLHRYFYNALLLGVFPASELSRGKRGENACHPRRLLETRYLETRYQPRNCLGHQKHVGGTSF